MVPDADALSRRSVLLGGGGLLAGALALGATRSGGATTPADAPWPMARQDPAGTGYAPETRGPADVTVRWRHELDTDLGFLAPSPVVAGGTVYAASMGVTAIDAEDGSERFRVEGESLAPPAVTPARAYRSPTVALAGPPTVGLHGDGGPELFDWRPAASRWTADAQESRARTQFGGRTQTPVVAVDGTVLAYVGSTLQAIEASSGAVRWRVDSAYGRPVVRDGTVFVRRRGRVYGYDLDDGEGQVVGEFDGIQESLTAAPDGLVVRFAESVRGVTPNGRERWRYTLPEDSTFAAAAPAVADGVVYVASESEASNRVLAIDDADGTLLWEAPVSVDESGDAQTPLAVGTERLYLPTDTGLVALDRADGRVAWRFGTDSGYPWSGVALAEGRVYAYGNGTVYALEEP